MPRNRGECPIQYSLDSVELISVLLLPSRIGFVFGSSPPQLLLNCPKLLDSSSEARNVCYTEAEAQCNKLKVIAVGRVRECVLMQSLLRPRNSTLFIPLTERLRPHTLARARTSAPLHSCIARGFTQSSFQMQARNCSEFLWASIRTARMRLNSS